MTIFTADLAEGGGLGLQALMPGPPDAQPTPPGFQTQWIVRSVDRFGVAYAQYPTAHVESLTETLDSWEEAVFTIPLDDDVSELPLLNAELIPYREVQIFRNGILIFWGIPTMRRVDSVKRVWQYTARGLLWVISRRNIGRGAALNETEAITFVATDQAAIVDTLMQHLQGRGPTANIGSVHNGKTDLNIAIACPPTGITRDREYKFADHKRGLDAITEFCKLADGFDVNIDMALGARTFRTHFPKIGTRYENLLLSWIRRADETTGQLSAPTSVGIVAWTIEENISDAANDVTEMAGNSAGRDEQTARSVTYFGDVTLEAIESTDQDIDGLALLSLAEGRRDQLGVRGVSVPQVTIEEPRDPQTQEVLYPLIGVLHPGDWITIMIIDGALTLTGFVYRIQQIRLDADTETMALQIIRDDDPQPEGIVA